MWGELVFGRNTHLDQLWRVAVDYLDGQIEFHKNDPYGDPDYQLRSLEDIKMLLNTLNAVLLEIGGEETEKED